MAPAMLAISNQFKSEICPCCQRSIFLREVSSLAFEEPSAIFVNMAMTNVAKLNSEFSECTEVIKDVSISPLSYKKLLAFLKSKQRGLQTSSTPLSTPSLALNRELDVLSIELSYLLEKRQCSADNLYVTAPRKLSEKHNDVVYQNDFIAEATRLARVFQTVESCLWYWKDLTSKEANKLLENEPLGTFLLRNSSDSKHLFTLSVVTPFGPTSIRITYSKGYFDFETDGSEKRRRRTHESIPNSRPKTFQQSVIHLILHYTKFLNAQQKYSKLAMTNDEKESNNSLTNPPNDSVKNDTVSQSSNDDTVSQDLPVAFYCSRRGPDGLLKFPLVLGHPYLRKTPSLCEQTRLVISKQRKLWNNPSEADDFPLSIEFSSFLKTYPYPV